MTHISFHLTNNDLHQLFGEYGKVVKVTIVKDRETRLSKGTAFIQFLSKDDAFRAIEAFDGKELNGRTVKCSLAIDNGRTNEFIRKRVYPDKSRCFECGEFGHLSYACPKNSLGNRIVPIKKRKKTKQKSQTILPDDSHSDGCNDILPPVIPHQKSSSEFSNEMSTSKRKRYCQSAYFSDEEEIIE